MERTIDLEQVLTIKTTPEAVLRAQLGSGEKILWMGRPRAGLRPADYGRIAFVLVCLALFLPLTWFLVFRPLASGRMGQIGFLGVLVLLYATMIRPVFETLRRSWTVYGVTDRRILVVMGRRRWKIESSLLRDLSTVALSEELPDGRGTIELGPALQFEQIEAAREVSETIRRAQMAVRFPESYPRSAAEATS